MVILRAINASWPRRIQFAALAGLASVSILAGESKDLRAEWFGVKKNRPPVESVEARTNEGFDKAIRNLLKEANRLEKKGELDQAIILSDRAAKIAEESSSLVKISPDLSASAISNYSKELRLKKKKVELSLKRAKTPSLNTAAVDSSRLTRESPPRIKPTRSSIVKSPVAAEKIANRSRGNENAETAMESTYRGETSSSRRNSETPVIVRNAVRDVPNSAPDEIPSSSQRPVEVATKSEKAGNVKTVVAEESTFEPFVDEEPRQAYLPPENRSYPQSTVASNEVIDTEIPDAKTDPENVTLISLSSIDSEKPPFDSNVVKLRYRYKDSKRHPTASSKSTSDTEMCEAEPIIPTETMETNETSSEQEQQLPSDLQDDESRDIQVRDLREEAADLRSASDLGESRPASTIPADESPEVDEEPQFAPAKTLSPFRIRRTLKLRNTYSVLPLLTPSVARSTRQPVIGRTSIVHWRPAKESSPVVADDAILGKGLKTVASAVEIRRMQSDNDKSVFDHGSTGIRHGSARDAEIQDELEATTESTVVRTSEQSDGNRSVARREIKGSLWDNAAVPTFDGTSRQAMPQSENQRNAPLPPKTNRIEQTAFTPPRHPVTKDLRSALNRDSIEATEQFDDSSTGSTSVTDDLTEISSIEQPDDTESWMDDVPSADAVVNNNLIQQSTGPTGLPESTVSTMLGTFGILLLIAGIWMVRATAGIKHD
jgi:hypothetical protein